LIRSSLLTNSEGPKTFVVSIGGCGVGDAALFILKRMDLLRLAIFSFLPDFLNGGGDKEEHRCLNSVGIISKMAGRG
jgi:hypothetical protein